MSNDIFNPSSFFVETPMVDQLKTQIQSWLWNGFLGGYILGNSRAGKSAAIRAIRNQLQNRHGQQIPVHLFSVPERDVTTVAGVFKKLCYSLRMKIETRATADVMSNDLVHYFADLACTNDTKQVVIIVDEMQRLSIQQIEVFNELHDALANFKLNLSVIFVGNIKTSEPILKKIKTPQCDHIWGRFFKNEYLFHGIRNQNELSLVLGEIDKTQTGIFLPKEFQSGWRVESISHLIWDIYIKDFKSDLKIHSWGMQYFIAMIRILLADYLPMYGIKNEKEIRIMVQNCIEASGLVEDLVRVYEC